MRVNHYDVTVIGTIFVDVKGFPLGQYHAQGRNLGHVHFYHGGVGRNVVETMAQLDVRTAFVSTVDDSGLGNEVIERLQQKGIDTSYVHTCEQGMGMWMAILNEKRDLAGSISQMPSIEGLEQATISKAKQYVQESKAMALEIDLSENIAQTVIKMAKENRKLIYGIPGNLDVIQKRLDLLKDIQCFICNEIEAERLSSIVLKDHESIEKAGQFFIDQGLKQIVITLGDKGCLYWDADTNDKGFVQPEPVRVLDTTGAGDSFFAGTVSALVRGQSLADAVKLGTKVAGITISVAESTCENLQERLEIEI